jgi:ABC-2 type transport system permease protein
MSATLLMTRRTLKRSLSGTIFLMIGLFIFEFVQPMVADSLGGGEGVAAMLERLPPVFQTILKTQPEFVALSGLPGYLSLGFSHPIYYVLTTAALAALICRSVAGELESGTMQLALARPVSRTSVYLSRLLAVAVTIFVITVVTFAGMVVGVAVANPDGSLNYSHILPTAVGAMLLLGAIGGVAMAVSASSDTTSQAVGWTTGFVVVSFVINYLAAMWSVIAPLDPLSIYSYFNPAQGLINGELAWRDAVILGAVALAGVVIGGVVFKERDLPS